MTDTRTDGYPGGDRAHVVFMSSPASSRTSGADILVDGAVTCGVQL